jgi:hypothetical protein
VANTRKEHTRQLHSTELVLKSSLAIDIIEFYRKLVAASKPAEIDLIPFSSFNPGHAFDEKPQSRFFLAALQQKGIEVDRFVDRLDSMAVNDPLPEELTLTELILRIKDIRSLQPSSTALIHHYVRPTDGRDNSNSRQNHPPPSSDSRLSHPPQPDSRPQPLQDFCTRTDTQCVCGRWGHSVDNCQQLAMHFLLAKHLKKDANLTSSSLC